jgi:hypothetical protein
MFSSFTNVELAAPIYPQMAFTASEIEQKKKDVGPIESASRSVASISNMIGDLIPSLTNITTPVSWASNLIAGVASAFGWSNPVNLEHAQRVTQSIYPYAPNCDNIDNSLPLSLYSSNSVETLPGFAGNDIDELCIDYLKAKPAFLTNVTWNESATADTQLWSTEVSPNVMYTSFASGSNTVYALTPVCFLSNFFNFYRGGLRFTFKIVKTEFHSGRLSLVFNPTASPSSSFAPNNIQSVYCHREIIDIREGNSFDFVVPYVALAPYKNCIGTYSSIGNLQLRVLNQLVAPATVSSSIQILVEVSAAPDMEFAFPITHSMNQTLVYNPQMSFVPKTDENSIVTGVIGESQLIHDQHVSSRACIGEKVVSMRSYLKKDDRFNKTYSANSYFTWFPFFTSWRVTSTTVGYSPNDPADNLSLISSCYLFQRGGVRMRAYQTASGAPGSNYCQTRLINCTSSTPDYTGSTGSNTPDSTIHGLQTYHSTLHGSFQEIQIPQYHRFPSRVVTDCATSSVSGPVLVGITWTAPTTSQSLVEFGNPSESYPAMFSRQAADDFDLGFFLGVPPVTYGTLH